MRTRILTSDEWAAKGGEKALALLPNVEPHNVNVIVVEDDDGKILARMGVYSMTYWEGIYIAPEAAKNLGVTRSLLLAARTLPWVRGQNWVFAAAGDSERKEDRSIRKFLRRLGNPIKAQFYAVNVKEAAPCPKK
jgi:hypothetical protein